jgi:hypothetical protein
MLVPGHISTRDAHARITAIEQSIEALFPEYSVQITTHIEPARHEYAHPKGHGALGDPLVTSPTETPGPSGEDSDAPPQSS